MRLISYPLAAMIFALAVPAGHAATAHTPKKTVTAAAPVNKHAANPSIGGPEKKNAGVINGTGLHVRH